MRAACRKGKLGPRRRAACGPGFPGRPGRAAGAASGEPRTRRRYGTRGRSGSGRDSGPTTAPGAEGSLGGRRRALVARRVTAARLKRAVDGTCTDPRSRDAGTAVGVRSSGLVYPRRPRRPPGRIPRPAPTASASLSKESKRIDTPRPRSGCPQWRDRRYTGFPRAP